jgi:hypothetical protein
MLAILYKMKFHRELTLMLLFAGTAHAQNQPACDSLTINCCSVNSAGPNTLTLTAENTSSVLFDYPGFALLDANGDTIAIETVNYVGIGSGPQTHVMNLVAPLTLPFTGSLQLYTLFFDTLACTFPVNLPDTITGEMEQQQDFAEPWLFPNPAQNAVFVVYMPPGQGAMMVTDLSGRILKHIDTAASNESTIGIAIDDLSPGVYLLKKCYEAGIRTARFVKL